MIPSRSLRPVTHMLLHSECGRGYHCNELAGFLSVPKGRSERPSMLMTYSLRANSTGMTSKAEVSKARDGQFEVGGGRSDQVANDPAGSETGVAIHHVGSLQPLRKPVAVTDSDGGALFRQCHALVLVRGPLHSAAARSHIASLYHCRPSTPNSCRALPFRLGSKEQRVRAAGSLAGVRCQPVRQRVGPPSAPCVATWPLRGVAGVSPTSVPVTVRLGNDSRAAPAPRRGALE